MTIQKYAVLVNNAVSTFADATPEFAATMPGWVLAGTSKKGDLWVGGEFVTPPVDLAPERAALVAQIDADVDVIYGLAIGNRQAEYEEAERQAHAYAQAGYTGTVPGMVASWATAKGWTAEQAADDILQQAAIWRGAQEAIRAARLLRKEQARAAATAEALAGVRAAWAAFVGVVRGQLGLGAA